MWLWQFSACSKVGLERVLPCFSLQVLLMRHAAMLIGQTGGGKSVILNTLARAQTRMGRRTTLHVLDPKASH